jgi:Tfp pilus assembly protein PilZ
VQKSEGGQEEKRSWPRHDLFVPVNYVIRGRAFCGFIRNMSENGVFVETCHPLSAGDELTLAFTDLRDRKNFRVLGEIKRVSPQGIGIRFKGKKVLVPAGKQRETERRATARLMVPEGVFVIVNAHVHQLGEILDLSDRGLGFVYGADDPLPVKAYNIDIFFPEAEYLLEKIGVESRSDSSVARGRRRQGVRFMKLGTEERCKLEDLRERVLRSQ